jgi:hypothetical protein
LQILPFEENELHFFRVAYKAVAAVIVGQKNAYKRTACGPTS